jgi:cAMP phosphodiesterase
MNKCTTRLLFFFFLYGGQTWSQTHTPSSFKVIPLGVKGGSDESNLSAYMLAAAGTAEYICLDAGTLHYGIQKAVNAGIFTGNASSILKNNIKGYLISHPHLDHVAGLIINSPDDSVKNIYGLPFCLDILRDNYFTWKTWANFADAGEKPYLNKYHYSVLSPGIETAIEHTSMGVKAFYLSHSNPYKSTAFLIRNADACILYLGDTGADTTEHANNLQLLWQEISPLIKEKKLKAIFIETSFSNEQPDKLLFGHLTPRLLMQEMNALGRLTGAAALKNFPIVITHQKPGNNRETSIKKQLIEFNPLRLKLIFPQQAVPMEF